jgi:hypothetical protein
LAPHISENSDHSLQAETESPALSTAADIDMRAADIDMRAADIDMRAADIDMRGAKRKLAVDHSRLSSSTASLPRSTETISRGSPNSFYPVSAVRRAVDSAAFSSSYSPVASTNTIASAVNSSPSVNPHKHRHFVACIGKQGLNQVALSPQGFFGASPPRVVATYKYF